MNSRLPFSSTRQLSKAQNISVLQFNFHIFVMYCCRLMSDICEENRHLQHEVITRRRKKKVKINHQNLNSTAFKMSNLATDGTLITFIFFSFCVNSALITAKIINKQMNFGADLCVMCGVLSKPSLLLNLRLRTHLRALFQRIPINRTQFCCHRTINYTFTIAFILHMIFFK